MDNQEVLRLPFNVARHKATFTNYLEVVIYPDGHIEYAVPSHTEKLLAVIARKHGISRDEAQALCPKEYYYDYITWLTMESGCVSVWNQFIIGSPSPPQVDTMTMLREEGLYAGLLPGEAGLTEMRRRSSG